MFDEMRRSLPPPPGRPPGMPWPPPGLNRRRWHLRRHRSTVDPDVFAHGMKVGLTSDGRGTPEPMTPDEAADMRRHSDAYDREIARIVNDEAVFLHERFLDLVTTGTTSIVEA